MFEADLSLRHRNAGVARMSAIGTKRTFPPRFLARAQGALLISFTSSERRGILLYRSACARKPRLLFRADTFQSWAARRSIPQSAACPRNPLAYPRPSLNRSTSSNELLRRDLKGIVGHTYYHQLAVGPQAVEQFGHCFRARSCRQDYLRAAHLLQCLHWVCRFVIDVDACSEFLCQP